MVPWSLGLLVSRFLGLLVSWCQVRWPCLICWHCGLLISWSLGLWVTWFLDLWSLCPLIPCPPCPLTLVYWSLSSWSRGVLVSCSLGRSIAADGGQKFATTENARVEHVGSQAHQPNATPVFHHSLPQISMLSVYAVCDCELLSAKCPHNIAAKYSDSALKFWWGG